MKHSPLKRKHRSTRHAVRSVLVLAVAALFISCGGGNSGGEGSGNQSLLAKTQAQADRCSDVSTLAGGMYHTVGLKADGTVVGAGYNGYGQLDVSSWKEITAVAAGMFHSVGARKDGSVAAAGDNGFDQLNVSSWTGIKVLAAGAYHTVGLKQDGTVAGAGYNGYGQLNVSNWKDLTAVAAGMYHTVGLKADGTVVGAGYNGFGQLNISSWKDITAIAAGMFHTVGLKKDGSVVAAGFNAYGQLNLASWTNIKALAAGAYHTVGLKEDGTVAAAGYSGQGQLNVASWTNIKALAAGMYHTIGLKEDGTVAAAGYNGFGQLDVGTLFTDLMPVCGPVVVTEQDIIAGSTTVSLTGTEGVNGWYLSDVQVTLSAVDNEGGSGVKEVHYSVDGVETAVAGCTASFTVTGDGTHTLAWHAVDNNGNAEVPQELTIKIDATAPLVAGLTAGPAVLWPPNHALVDVFIDGAVSDGGSGIASTTITVTDEYGTHAPAVPGFGSAVQLESWREGSDKDGRLYIITAVTTDAAGNESTATAKVIVPHDMR